MFIKRQLESDLHKSIKDVPVTAVLGARQTGKTTLVKQVLKSYGEILYMDLEKPSDRFMLTDAESFFRINNNKIICLDEIQLFPEIFSVLRSIIDDDNYHIKFLVTGSGSPELLRQKAESLAGRIAYYELTPFLYQEISPNETLDNYWLKGGFPLSLLAETTESSNNWRRNFILTFLERDLRNFGFNFPPETLNRLWKMIAHINGQVLNYSQLSNSLGYSDTTVRKYLEVLSKTFMLRILPPFFINLKKRLIKSPKLYIKDTGILHSLLNINDFNELYINPIYGSSWELLCMENIIYKFNNWEPFYYRTSNGSEVDLVLTKASKKYVFEFKASSSPSVTLGFWNCLEDLKPDKSFIISPVKMAYPYKNDVWVYPLDEFLKLKLT
ncbi:MAG: ATP-binding protein [Bacteroidetes bacterium]|nr:ATP-binding protein [Bacteroidota bacterium]